MTDPQREESHDFSRVEDVNGALGIKLGYDVVLVVSALAGLVVIGRLT